MSSRACELFYVNYFHIKSSRVWRLCFPDLTTDGEPQFPHCQNENSACPKTQQIGIRNTVQCLPLDKPSLITKSGGSSESCTE